MGTSNSSEPESRAQPGPSSDKPKGPRDSPDHENTGWPPGVPYIIGNEGCERFSYYGMRSILTLYMATVLYANHPEFQADPEGAATRHYHLFTAAVYALPMIGAIVADRLLGKYRTIIGLSLVYCAGHGVLAAFEDDVWGLWVGLGLIAVGSGGIKPCVSAHVGDQFGRSNWFRVRTIFQAFYFIINFGSSFSTLLIPWVWRSYGASLAFGIPGILMLVATLAFWMGRNEFVHVPPKPGGTLGLLDTASSVSLFMTFGHLFFTGSWAWYWLVLISAVFLAVGLVLFVVRQRLEQDDGFLAVVLWALWNYVAKLTQKQPAAEMVAAGAGGPDMKVVVEERDDQDELALKIEGDASERKDALVRSSLFGPVVRRFGLEAAEGPVAVLKIISVFFLVSVFWALFDQHGSSWILQAKAMNLTLWGEFAPGEDTSCGFDRCAVLPSQVPSINPILVMILIPITNKIVYPGVEKLGFEATPLRRMTAGMVIAAFSFVAVALIQQSIDGEGAGTVPIAWQVIPYVIITLAEVMVSITGLEFAYTQAPKRMKSTIMGFWLLTVALGQLLVPLVMALVKWEWFRALMGSPGQELPPAIFFWVFAVLMLAAGVLFGIRSYFYKLQDFVQH